MISFRVAPAMLAALSLIPLPASAASDGATLYKTCAGCHGSRGQGGSAPPLKNVAGRAAGSAPDFAYSGALRKSGLRWTPAQLAAFLLAPQKTVPGNRMAYAGAKTKADADALAAYLSTLK